MLNAEWVNAVYGGLLIGVAAAALLVFTGRILGVSGIINRVFPMRSDSGWRVAFILGVLAGGFFSAMIWPEVFATIRSETQYSRIALAGLLVGFGTRRGNGCTSGHGICGVGRLSVRSLAATVVFILTGIAAAMLGGSL